MLILLDTYEKLLTDTQAKILRMRFDEDMSLSEIGELCSVSRQAAHDAIVKGEQKLRFYEENLHLAKKENDIRNLISLMKKENADIKYIDLLEKLTEEQ